MKKIIAILMLFVAMNATAQHINFIGIPLNGSIDVFQQKLIAKGFTLDRDNPNPEICRWFDGVFCGYKATIVVWYDTKSKIVYRAKAMIDRRYYKDADETYEDIGSMLHKKYSCVFTDEYEGHESIVVYVLKDNSYDCDTEDYLGTIDLFIGKKDVVHVDYLDRINSDKHQLSKASDL